MATRINPYKLILTIGCLNIVLIIWFTTEAKQWIIPNIFNQTETSITSRFEQSSVKNISSSRGNATLRYTIENERVSANDSKYSTKRRDNCPGILSGMAHGHWIKRPLTPEEQLQVDNYLREERGAFYIPPTYQRSDNRCGNVPYVGSPQYKHMWFKSICNPKGETPCCKNNRCVSLSEDQCQCTDCSDERSAIHAEYAKWQPGNTACGASNYSTSKACQLLRGWTISFIGDSFIRHVFAALVVLLSGNIQNGALKKNLAAYQRQTCSGWHQITGLICRELLIEQISLCDGTVKVDYTEVFSAKQLPVAIPVLQSHQRNRKSLMILSLGIHNDFRADIVTTTFLKPFLNINRWLSQRPTDIDSVINAIKTFNANITTENSFNVFNKITAKNMFNSIRSNNFLNKLYSYIISSYQSSDIEKMNATLNKNIATGISPQRSKLNSIPHSNLELNGSPDKSPSFSSTSPNLLWVGAHSPGLLKSQRFPRQTYAGVLSFNSEVYKLLDQWQVPYLDTLGFTNGTVSYDGTHYGWGINMLKVNMILTYIEKVLKSDL